ncbi:unnamed protein product [Cunninghamella echinulata]
MKESIDAKTPKYMVYCVTIACLTSLSFGWVIGSPNVPGEITHNCPTGNAHLYNSSFPDCLPMSTYLWAFAVASFCIGGFVGGLGTGYIQTKLGRKKTIFLTNIGFVLGSIIISLSLSPGMFIAGRIICGLSCGMCSLVIPTYIGEISTIRARGAMGCFHQFFIAVGIFFSTFFGIFLSNVPYWRLNYGMAGFPAVLQLIAMTTCVESPRWFISMNKIDEGRYTLQKLRGTCDIDEEFYEMVKGQVGGAAADSMIVTNYDQHQLRGDGTIVEKKKDLKTEQRRLENASRRWSMQATLVEKEDLKDKKLGDEEDNNHSDNNNDDEGEKQHLDNHKHTHNEEEDNDDDENNNNHNDNDDDDDPETKTLDHEEEKVMAPEDNEIQTLRPKNQQISLSHLFQDPVLRKMTFTILVTHVLQQLMGFSVFMYYSTMTYAYVINDSSSYLSSVTSTYGDLAIGDTAMNLIFTVIAIALMDRLGRRPLLLISELGTILFSLILFLACYFKVSALLIVGVYLYISFYAIGFGPIPWLLTVELCPTYTSSIIGGLTNGVNWLVHFFVALFFPILFATIQGYTFLIFTVIGIISLFFTYFNIFETKNQSIEKIYEKYRA